MDRIDPSTNAPITASAFPLESLAMSGHAQAQPHSTKTNTAPEAKAKSWAGMAVEVDCSLSLGSANAEQTDFVPFPPDAFPFSNRCGGKAYFRQFSNLGV